MRSLPPEGDIVALEAQLERARRRLERCRQVQAQVAEQFARREVLYGALLLANDELERAQREYNSLRQRLRGLVPKETKAAPKEAPLSPPRQATPRKERKAKPSPPKQAAAPRPMEGQRERKAPECSDCTYYDFRLDTSDYRCRLSGRAIADRSQTCEHFVAANPCPVCGHPIGSKKTRPPKYCSDRCRKLAWWRKRHGKATQPLLLPKSS